MLEFIKPLKIKNYFNEDEEPQSLIANHRCREMLSHEYERNLKKPKGAILFKFMIKYSQGEWNLYNNDEKGMVIVQCPFCHHKMFAGNEVTIE